MLLTKEDFTWDNKTGGIYQIKNMINNKVYIGSTKYFYRRFKRHENDLLSNKHDNTHLQRAWNKYGENNFIHEIIEVVNNVEDILNREQYWLDKLQPFHRDNDYNICSVAGKTIGFKHSDKTKKLLSDKGKGLKRTEETKKRISEGHKGINTWTKGMKQSEEHIEKRVKNRRGVPLSDDIKDKMSIKVLMFNKDNQLLKEYFSISSAQKDGFDPSAIVKCCKGKLKTYKGYKWMYKSEYEKFLEEVS